MRVLSLFDGIGIGRQALKDLRVPVTSYHASEICPHAIRVCRSNHDDVTHVGDVRQLTADALPETIDLLLGAPPRRAFAEPTDDGHVRVRSAGGSRYENRSAGGMRPLLREEILGPV